MAVKKRITSRAFKKGESKKLSVGFFDGAAYPDGTPVAYVASIHEFGGRNTPRRAFMRPAIKANIAKWKQLFAQRIAKKGSLAEALTVVGESAAGDVAVALKEVTTPALSPATVRRKGFAKPLVDSGKMLQSITYEVSDE